MPETRMIARCPICQRQIEDRAFGPFCSERCRLIDLDNWLAGRYRISTRIPADTEEEQDVAGEPRSGREVE